VRKERKKEGKNRKSRERQREVIKKKES